MNKAPTPFNPARFADLVAEDLYGQFWGPGPLKRDREGLIEWNI
jgi:hypothetical protein